MRIKNLAHSGEMRIETPRRDRTNVLVFSGNGNTLTVTNARGKRYSQNTTHTNSVTAIFEDLERSVYTGSADSTVKKFNSELSQQWSYSEITGQVTAMAMNYEDGYLYVASSTGDVAKLDPEDGNQLWRVQPNSSSSITDIHISIAGEVYVASSNNTVKKIETTDGEVIWNMTAHSATVNTIVTNLDREVFSGDINGRIVKCDPEGNIIKNEAAVTGAVLRLKSDIMGRVHSLSASGKVQSFNSDLSEMTSFDAQGVTTASNLTIDHLGRFYVKGESTIVCYSQVGEVMWDTEGHNSSALFVTLIPVIVQPEITEARFVELEAPTNLQAS